MYEAKLGRFVSRDPLLQGDVEVLYPVPDYCYANQNPATTVDPSGMGHWSKWIARMNALGIWCGLCAWTRLPDFEDILKDIHSAYPDLPGLFTRYPRGIGCYDGTECNAVMHCYASCLLQEKCGTVCCLMVTLMREGPGTTNPDDLMDICNDIIGVGCAEEDTDCLECCKNLLDGGDLCVIKLPPP